MQRFLSTVRFVTKFVSSFYVYFVIDASNSWSDRIWNEKADTFCKKKTAAFYNDALTHFLIAICKFKTACYLWMKSM